jgi:hypothetical protein
MCLQPSNKEERFAMKPTQGAVLNTYPATLSILVFALGTVLASGCSLLGGNDSTGRTYPGALDLEEIEIAALNRTAPLPGAYNIRGYVISVHICPPEALCLIADGISVFARNEDDPVPEDWIEDGIHLVVEDPGQFQTGRRYVFSVRVEHERYPGAQPFAQLLGYSRVR